MKRIYNYIMLLVVAFSYASCTNDDIDALSIEAKTGEEVQFGLSLDNGTRTVYGPEENNAFPIYWANGDKVQIYSPECSEGRNDAEYSVKPVAGKSYAESLTKTGEYGVQWGDNTTANFYSVYPSLNAEFSGTGENVTAKLHISKEQKSNQSGVTSADMDNVIMYAQTNGAEAGKTVNLKYIPYSTVFEFTANLGQTNNGYGKVKIVSLTLKAPTGTAIAGDFNLKFNGNNPPQITAAGNNSNVITLVPETQPLLNEANQTAKINLAMIPLSGVNDLEGWTVTINVLEGNETTTKAYTKKLDGNYALAPGKIHKISLPKITPAVVWTYNLSNWISSLYQYQQIYLTELSLPGAWYAGGKIYTTDWLGRDESYQNYQATNNMTTLWNAGVRAFAVECRTSSTRSGSIFSGGYTYTPSSVVVSGTQDNSGDACTNGTQIRTLIKSIADAAAATLTYNDDGTVKDGEFAVFVLSYADGGSTGRRDEDFKYFINGIKTEIANSGATNIVTNVTKDTTVGDVLGKLIIKISVDDDIPVGSYTTQDMNALFSYNPHMKQLSSDKYSTPIFSKLYWKTWADANKVFAENNNSDFLWCFSSANRTQANTGTNTTIPTFAQRQTALRAMITNSRKISAAGTHNVWFYFNAGGVVTTSQTDDNTNATAFASDMNNWLLEVIKLKSNGGTDTNGYYTGTAGTIVESDPSPLGIVMFNQCTGDNATYKGADIIKAIVDMNDKFKLQRRPVTMQADYDGSVSKGGNVF
jgi:hypothetical protein